MRSKYVYGPVPSRRLGFSLGIDVIPFKNCSFNCIYCQLGKTTNRTVDRKEYYPTVEISKEIREMIHTISNIDYLTFSGSGEPTLHSQIGYLINELKKITNIPITVLTNGSLLHISDVRRDLQNADVVLPTLCTTTQGIFEKIHRPHPTVTIKKIIQGLIDFRMEFKGKIWLEIMLIKGMNDSSREIAKLNEITAKIMPDKIQLNTVVRPPSEKWALPLSYDELKSIQESIGNNCEIIAHFRSEKSAAYRADIEKTVYDTVKRRPVTIDDLHEITGLHNIELLKYLDELTREKKIVSKEYKGKKYYEKYND